MFCNVEKIPSDSSFQLISVDGGTIQGNIIETGAADPEA